MAIVCGKCKGGVKIKNIDRIIKKYGDIYCNKCCREISAIEKYGSLEKYNEYCQEKREKSFLKKYGVKNPSQIDEIREKTNESIKQSQEKRMISLKQNNMINFGVEYTFQRSDCKENIKKTIKERYGVEHPLQNSNILKKAQNTILELYGYNNVMKNPEEAKKISNKFRSKTCEEWSKIASKRRRKYNIDEIQLDSQWEIKVYNFCKENNIQIERGPVVLLSNGSKFEIDFIINGRLCEIKSSYYIKMQKNANEKLEYLKNHNGIIISDDEIKDLSFLLK